MAEKKNVVQINSGTNAANNTVTTYKTPSGEEVALTLNFLLLYKMKTKYPTTYAKYNEIIMKGLRLQGIYGRKMFETWYQMKAMVQGGLDLSPIITHRYHYTEFEKGFEAMLSGNSGKVVLDWTTKK